MAGIKIFFLISIKIKVKTRKKRKEKNQTNIWGKKESIGIYKQAIAVMESVTYSFFFYLQKILLEKNTQKKQNEEKNYNQATHIHSHMHTHIPTQDGKS